MAFGNCFQPRNRLLRSERLSNMLAKLVLSNIFENSVVWAFCVFFPCQNKLANFFASLLAAKQSKGTLNHLHISCWRRPARARSWRCTDKRWSSSLAFNNRVTLAHRLTSVSHLTPAAAAPLPLLSHGPVHLKIVQGEFESWIFLSVHGYLSVLPLST